MARQTQTKSASKKKKASKMKTTKKKASSAQSKKKATPKPAPKLGLSNELLLQMHRLMVKSRALEERLIKIYKTGEAFFWIGGPGEEAYGVPLGLLANKGQGPKHDYFHLHYRCTPTMVALGMPMIDSIRLIMNRSTDTSTGGRNFSNHYCYPEWNVVPVGSPIEVQYQMAIGTAHVQKRHKAGAVTIVTGGDAGSAEGDFASCLVWASRPANPLPILITVQNNGWGISTDYDGQHGETSITDRGKAFNMRTRVINGNDPIESYIALQEEMEYIRKEQKPVLLEAKVSRLYGHSSASGANFVQNEDCCINMFEERLMRAGLLTEDDASQIKAEYEAEARAAQEQVRLEPSPQKETLWDHVYTDGENGDWRKF
ncbi:MAG: thiamine pyrophosphate-dependent dehydrogenase E1 component subunit alpha [Bdellovibrionales bacterium]|nr:thiamine pyrophosphate-dependent dehydrogenase E1 component subunit alpha [Bdellovibrionales bacterium]